jgi:predicted Ser/Thr protein kinase
MNRNKILERKIYKKINNGNAWCPRDIRGSSSGCSGSYIQIDKNKGIKLLCETYPNLRQATQYALPRAIEEFNNAVKVRKVFKLAPKMYGYKIIKLHSGNYVAGIIQQHLGNTVVYDTKIEGATSTIRKRLGKVKIYHDDLHQKNIMYHKGKLYVIDFSAITFKS